MTKKPAAKKPAKRKPKKVAVVTYANLTDNQVHALRAEAEGSFQNVEPETAARMRQAYLGVMLRLNDRIEGRLNEAEDDILPIVSAMTSHLGAARAVEEQLGIVRSLAGEVMTKLGSAGNSAIKASLGAATVDCVKYVVEAVVALHLDLEKAAGLGAT